MGAFRNFIIGTLGVAVVAGATALAIPQSRNFVLDKIAQKSEIYKTAVANNDDLKKSNDDKTAEIVKLQGELETKKQHIAKCESDLKSVTETKTTIETQLASKTTEVEELTADKTKLTTDLETANAVKANLQTQLDSVTAEKQALETKKSELTTQVESLTEQKTELENQLATANSDKVSLQSQLENVNKQLTTTQTELINTQTSLQSKTAEADTLTNQLSDKQNQIDTLTSQLSAKQTELDTANADKANLQTQLDSAIAEINELKTKVSELEKDKTNLQNQILEEISNNGSIMVESLLSMEFVDSSNNHIVNFGLDVIDGGAKPYEEYIISGTDLAKYADSLSCESIHSFDTYLLQIPSVGDVKFSRTHDFYKVNDGRLVTTFNIQLVDKNNNAFDFAAVNPDSNYRLSFTRFDFTCFHPHNDLHGTNYEGQINILKTVDATILVMPY